MWVATQTGLFFFFGINSDLESLKYIRAAENLLQNGHFPEVRYFFYLTTTLVIALGLKTGAGFTGVVIIQLIINFIATFRFYFALKHLEKKRFSAFITTLLLVTFFPYQAWNYYLFTESLFYSSALLFFASCLMYTTITRKAIAVQLLFLVLTIISRPLGIVFLPCWILFIARKQKINFALFLTLFVSAAVVAVVVCNIILGNIGDWEILKPAEYGYIICDIPSRAYMSLSPFKQHSPLLQLWLFVINYPSYFLQLTVDRLQAFFFLIRSYYSASHNLYLAAYAAIFLAPAVVNLFLYRKKIFTTATSLLSFLIVAAFSTAIMLQCDDYHNRFHHAIIPVFLYCGAFLLLEKIELPFFRARK